MDLSGYERTNYSCYVGIVDHAILLMYLRVTSEVELLVHFNTDSNLRSCQTFQVHY